MANHVRSQDVVELGYTPFFGSYLSGNPSLSCMFSPIHSPNLVARYWSTGWCFLYEYYRQTRSAGPERSILSGATANTASEALDPGERRLYLLADQPGKPTYQEKSKYERYTQSITMVYPWDIFWRDIFSRQYITSYEPRRDIEYLSHRPRWNSYCATKSTLARKSLCSLWTLLVSCVLPDVPEACKDINV